MPLFSKKPAKVEKKSAKPAEKKPAAKKSSVKAAKQQAPRKAAEKITPKKVDKKKNEVNVKKAGKKSGAKVFTPVKENTGKRVYHVSKRPDGKWAVKFAGGEKAIKLFNTQAEAKEYTEKMADNQGGVVLVHNSKGKNKGRIQ